MFSVTRLASELKTVREEPIYLHQKLRAIYARNIQSTAGINIRRIIDNSEFVQELLYGLPVMMAANDETGLPGMRHRFSAIGGLQALTLLSALPYEERFQYKVPRFYLRGVSEAHIETFAMGSVVQGLLTPNTTWANVISSKNFYDPIATRNLLKKEVGNDVD